jgi:hypothetical protein
MGLPSRCSGSFALCRYISRPSIAIKQAAVIGFNEMTLPVRPGQLQGGTVDDILPVSRRGVCRKSTRIGVRILLPLSGVIVQTRKNKSPDTNDEAFSFPIFGTVIGTLI